MPKKGALFLAGFGSRAVSTHVEADIVIACDRAAFWRLENGARVDMAIGDFDSVTPREKQVIVEKAGKTLTLPVAKDDTDSQVAVKWFFERYPKGELSIYGALGGRLDHSLVNLFLPSHPDLAPFMRQITLVSQDSYVTYHPAGYHNIKQVAGYDGLSFLVEGNSEIEISGAEFELKKEHYFKRKVYSSNHFASEEVELRVPEGAYVICMQTREE